MKLSFVIPVYNAEKYLRQCLCSLLSQTSKEDIEFLLVNDGSKDSSLEICNTYKLEDNRIVVINQSNQGSQAARNAGIRAARGKYVCFVDSDDYVSPTLVSDLSKILVEYTPDIVLYDADKVNDVGKVDSFIKHDIEPGYYSDIQNNAEILDTLLVTHDLYGIRNMNCTLWSKCIRRDILLSVIDSFDCSIEIGEDLGISVASFFKANTLFRMEPFAYYHYRHNPNSIMNRYKEKLFDKSMILCNYLSEQSKNYSFSLGVDYERCFFAISAYYNEYFFKSSRSNRDRQEVMVHMCESRYLKDSLDRINLKEVKNPNRLILNMIRKKSVGSLSMLGKAIRFFSPILRKFIRI